MSIVVMGSMLAVVSLSTALSGRCVDLVVSVHGANSRGVLANLLFAAAARAAESLHTTLGSTA